MPDDIVIVAAARTPQGRLKGQLASFSAAQLGGFAIAGALAQGGIPADAVDAVILGQVLPAGAGQNPARQAALLGGIGWDVPASSVNKVCLSGLAAIIDAKRMIAVGDATVVVAGGMESMTRAPHLLAGSRDGWTYGSVEVLDHMAYDGLTDAYDRESMGASTERLNPSYRVGREEQDRVAALSHQRAAAARESGVFDAEIVPVEVPQRRGAPVTLTADEGIRPDTTAETLGGLRAAFAEGGTITAGNASQISDGASAVVVTRTRPAGPCWPSSAPQDRSRARTTRCTRSRRGRSRRPSAGRGSPRPTSTSSRSTRPSAPSSPSPNANSASRRTSSTCTAAASRSGIRSAPPDAASSCTPCTSSSVAAAGPLRSASAAAAVKAKRSS